MKQLEREEDSRSRRDSSDDFLWRPEEAPKKRRSFRRFVVIFIITILLAVILYAGYLLSIVAKVSTEPWQLSPLSADANGRTNILVLGVGDPGHAGEKLSDSLMLVSLDKQQRRVAQVSIPRDMRVTIPGYGRSKINAANAYGGVDLAQQTVANTFDTQVDYYLQTNFSGLKGVVDAVGGLDIDVKEPLVDREYPCDDNQYKVCGLNIQPGLQHMDGAQVLKYVRCRKGTCGNDFGRAERQQEVLNLLKPKVLDASLLWNPARLKTLSAAVQSGIKTDMSLWQLVSFANRWRTDSDNRPVNLVLSTAKDGYLRSDPAGSSDLLPIGGNFTAIANKFRTLFE